jgi:hypothetical protein
VSYEQLFTNIYGYNVSYSGIRESKEDPGKPAESVFRKYLEVGPMLEFAPYPHWNVGAQFNLAYNNDFGITYHVKLLATFIWNRGSFGLRTKDQSPFF